MTADMSWLGLCRQLWRPLLQLQRRVRGHSLPVPQGALRVLLPVIYIYLYVHHVYRLLTARHMQLRGAARCLMTPKLTRLGLANVLEHASPEVVICTTQALWAGRHISRLCTCWSMKSNALPAFLAPGWALVLKQAAA